MINKILPVAVMLAATTSASAEILNDTTPFVAEVNAASAGPELITPQYLELDFGQGGCTNINGCLKIRFQVSKFVFSSNVKWSSHLYFTPERRVNYPASCQTIHDKDWHEKYVLIDNKMAVAIQLSITCGDTPEWTEVQNSFVYMTDVSQSNGSTKVGYYPNHELVGIDKTLNLNNYGATTDLMVTVFDTGNSNNKSARFDVYEPNNFNLYISNLVAVDR